MDLGPKAEMREIRTSGLMSGIWKRNGMNVTAPDLDSTKPKLSRDFCAIGERSAIYSVLDPWPKICR
jgi:hypothetical protein